MSSVLPTRNEKPRFVADMFGRIVPRYDLLNTLMTAGQDQRWRRALARAVTAQAVTGGLVLDVGTGTGKLAQAVREVRPDARIVGVDFTLRMLRAALRPLQRAGADALRLPFADAQFDAVVSAFLVRNLADPSAGIAEQLRVLRPGGRIAILETTPGPEGALRPLFRMYLRSVLPTLGTLIAGDAAAYSYLPESTLAFVEPTKLVDMLRDAGCVEVGVQRLAFGCVAVTVATKPYGRAVRVHSPPF